MLSAYTSCLSVAPGVSALLNNLVFSPVFLPDTDAQRILAGGACSKEVEESLRAAGVLVDDESADARALGRLREDVNTQSNIPRILYLVLTTQCNLACSYCFIQESPLSTLPQQHMSFSTAARAVDVFIKQSDDPCQRNFFLYGGEPTLNRKLFEEIVHYIKKESPESTISVVTNGTLIDEHLVRIFKEGGVSVGISLDGPKDINDLHRTFRSGARSVYNRVAKSIELLREHGVPFGISLTVSEAVLDHQDEVLEWLLVNHLNPFLNPMHFTMKDDAWASKYSAMSDFMLRVARELPRYGAAEGRLADTLAVLSSGRIKHQGCGALGRNQIAVRPNGDVGVCHGDSQSESGVLWNIEDPPIDPFAHAEEYWQTMLPVNQEACLKCEAFTVCGGGCPLQAEALFGSRSSIDLALCIYNRKVAAFLLEELYLLQERR